MCADRNDKVYSTSGVLSTHKQYTDIIICLSEKNRSIIHTAVGRPRSYTNSVDFSDIKNTYKNKYYYTVYGAPNLYTYSYKYIYNDGWHIVQ